MSLEKASINHLASTIQELEKMFDLPPYELEDLTDITSFDQILDELSQRMGNNYPYFHPLYAGQMIKPPHAIARFAYMMSMWINPNNHALDGGKASSQMEKEVIRDLAAMFGWSESLGHLTGGGTMANLEALWVSSRLHPGKRIIASDQAHYTHQRLADVLQIPISVVKTDQQGYMDMQHLKYLMKTREIGTVITTIGTTGLGAVDPIDQVLELQEEHHFRIHADAAYGGYYMLCDRLKEETRARYDCLTYADSIVIDPHKHGLQPYGCGCVLFRDVEVARFYLHDSPYTYFSSEDLHLGEISLECSRPGASAVALWTTMKAFPLIRGGYFASALSKSRQAALHLSNLIKNEPRFILLTEPDLDIVCWGIKAHNTEEMSRLARELFSQCESRGLYLALMNHPVDKIDIEGVELKDTHLVCLRSCLMKENHLEWIPQIWGIIQQSLEEMESG